MTIKTFTMQTFYEHFLFVSEKELIETHQPIDQMKALADSSKFSLYNSASIYDPVHQTTEFNKNFPPFTDVASQNYFVPLYLTPPGDFARETDRKLAYTLHNCVPGNVLSHPIMYKMQMIMISL